MNNRFEFRIWLEDEADMIKSPLHTAAWGYLNKRHPVMQYTGYKDIKGKKIYEGDILKSDTELVYLASNMKVPNSEHTTWYEVFWNETAKGWAVKTIKTTRDKNFGLNQIFTHYIHGHILKSQIVGNIYENPDLL